MVTGDQCSSPQREAALFCGIDWASSRYDGAIVDDAGTVIAQSRIGSAAAGRTV